MCSDVIGRGCRHMQVHKHGLHPGSCREPLQCRERFDFRVRREGMGKSVRGDVAGPRGAAVADWMLAAGEGGGNRNLPR